MPFIARTQDEFDEAVSGGYSNVEIDASQPLHLTRDVRITLTGRGSVEVYNSSTVTVASPDVAVRTMGRAVVYADQGKVAAYAKSVVHASGNADVKAGPGVQIHVDGGTPTIEGGVQIVPQPQVMLNTEGMAIEDWAAFYGLETSTDADGEFLTVYKGVNDDLVSDHGTAYPVGAVIEANDWNAAVCCGYGLHFSPTPVHTGEFTNAQRYLECRIATTDVVTLGNKVKARKCTVVREVDVYGQPVAADAVADAKA